MKQELFQSRHQAEWDQLRQWLNLRANARAKPGVKSALEVGLIADSEFPALYRRVCQQFALAERRGYSAILIEQLSDLVQRGHHVLYRPKPTRASRMLAFFAADFPILVRAQWRAMAVSAFLFFVPLIAMMVVLQYRPELIHSVFDVTQIAEFEHMYDPANEGARLARDNETDLAMFGYYILNNVSIGFRTFASGVLLCVPSILVLVGNGVVIGGVAGHLIEIGYGQPFWRFVAGHSAPELMAIVIAGGAGLQIGMAVIAPGRRTRGRALVESGVIGAKLALGVFAMLLFAAFIEAYWSSIARVPALIKYIVGVMMWLLILGWLLMGGRGRPPETTP